MVALSVLVSGLDAEMARLGYKDSTMVWYRGCWRRLRRYFAARGAEEFSLDLAMAWVDEACGFGCLSTIRSALIAQSGGSSPSGLHEQAWAGVPHGIRCGACANSSAKLRRRSTIAQTFRSR